MKANRLVHPRLNLRCYAATLAMLLAVFVMVGCGGGEPDPGSSATTGVGADDSAGANADTGARTNPSPSSDGAARSGEVLGIDRAAKRIQQSIPDLSADEEQRARELIGQLGTLDVNLSWEAEAELVAMGAGAVPLLIDSYRDENQRRRLHVVRALGRIAHPRAIRYLRDALKDPWRAVRIEAAQALEPLLEPDDEFTATELVSVIKNDTEPIVKTYAAKALLSVDNMMGVPLLVENLKKRLWPREISVEALRAYSGENFGFEPYACASERIGPADAWDRWFRGHVPLHQNLIEYLGVYKFLFADTAKRRLIEIGRDASVSLIAGLQHDNDHVRTHCAEILGVIEEQDAVAALIQALADENPMVRLQSAIALGKIGDTAASDALHQSAGDTDRDVRAASIMALGKLRDADIEKAAALNEEPGDLAELARLFCLFGRAGNDAKLDAADRVLTSGSPLSLPWLIARRDQPAALESLRGVAKPQRSNLVMLGISFDRHCRPLATKRLHSRRSTRGLFVFAEGKQTQGEGRLSIG